MTIFIVCLFMYVYMRVFIFRAVPVAYGSSQARGRIEAEAAGLHHSHSNVESKPHLQATPQLMAIPDPQPAEQSQGLNLSPHGC